MGKFLRGLLFGLGLGALIAPMRGQEMRRLLTDRFQELRGYIPERTELNQYTQQISEKATQTASTLKDYAQQATAQVKDTASNLGDLAQQASVHVKDTASNLGDIAQQAGTSTKGTASDLGGIAQQAGSDAKSAATGVAQQASAKVKDAVSNLSDTAQQATAQVKNATSSVVNTVQQAGSNVKDTASNLVDTTKQAASSVKDTSKAAINSVTPTVTQAQQNVQPSQATSPAALSPSTISATTSTSTGGDSLSTIPGIEPEIQSKLEAQGIHTKQQLLDQTSTKEERGELSQKAAVSTHMLRTLADRADLMRLQGVSADIAVMLEEAGVNGSRDLRRRNPEHLHATLTEAHSTGNIATSVPDMDRLTQWIAEAMAITSSQE
ncbi:MAG: hypothetical protein PVS3B3_05270 [Ktedonobacteraceae bacterium]